MEAMSRDVSGVAWQCTVPPPELPDAVSSSATSTSRQVSVNAPPVAVVRAKPKKAKKKKGTMQLLHMAFHPGCDCEGESPDEVMPRARSSSDPNVRRNSLRRVSRSIHCGDTDKQKEQSLNMMGALLHLWMDIARSIVILCAGILIVARLVYDPFQADAACAMIVGVCVIVGSASLLRSICLRLLSGSPEDEKTAPGDQLPSFERAASAHKPAAVPLFTAAKEEDGAAKALPPPPAAYEGYVRKSKQDRKRPARASTETPTPPIDFSIEPRDPADAAAKTPAPQRS